MFTAVHQKDVCGLKEPAAVPVFEGEYFADE